MWFSEESWSKALPEIERFFPDHYQSGVVLKQYPLKLNLDGYTAMEALGLLHLLVARVEGKAVGYCVVFLLKDMHQSVPIAVQDMVYIEPEHRNGFAIKRLYRTLETQLRHKGVVIFQPSTGPHTKLGAIFQQLGYHPVERVYAKVLHG